MLNLNDLSLNYETLLERIEKIPSSNKVKILPVTKNHPPQAIALAKKIGFDSVGENKVQEALEKLQTITKLNINCELIGHLQSNKVKKAVEIFHRIQSVDSIKLIDKINSSAQDINKTQKILLQINAGNDPAKFGASINQAKELLEFALSKKNIFVDGLMTIAPLDENLNVASKCFENLRKTAETLRSEFNVQLKELSMGMSDDLEQAIEQGSTLIRVGTFLFGNRIYS